MSPRSLRNTSTSDNPYTGGGRVIALILLFAVALYMFYSKGIAAFTIAFGIVPVMVLLIGAALKYQMLVFWVLFVFNYLVFFLNRMGYMPLPLSVPNELFEMVLIALAIIDAGILRFEKLANNMFLALLIWLAYCLLEILNDTCEVGGDFTIWFTGARLIVFQLIYAFIVFSIYLDSPKKIMTWLKVWAGLVLFAALWCFKQQKLGFNDQEKIFLIVAARTHIVNGITRYFSIFSDAANFGISMSASATLFFIVAVSSKIKKDKILFFIAGFAATWAFFQSGTRTAIFCLLAGLMVYVVMSKSVKIAAVIGTTGAILVSLLMFTTIGNGIDSVRRMRSGFNSKDASANVRKVNQAVIAKYMKDAPFGIGIGVDYSNVPETSKMRKVATIPPDSEYVYIWVHTGYVGITIFLLTTLLMWLSACYIVMFKIKNKAVHGIGAGLCSAFIAYQLGGYGNQILMQFPNVVLFYGGLSVVFALPRLEKEFIKLEEERYAVQLEQERIKKEKKLEKRV